MTGKNESEFLTRRIPLILVAAIACVLCETAMAGTFGDGYKSAKWGMSPDKVEEAIQSDGNGWQAGELKTYSDTGQHFIEFTGEGKGLTCIFFEDKLYRVKYEPVQKDDDEKGVEAVLRVLRKKYGNGKVLDDCSAGMFPGKCVVWDDGATEIRFQMADGDALRRSSPDFTTYPSSTAEVLYTSKRLRRKMEQAQKQSEQKKDEDELKEKTNKVGNDL